MRYDRPEQIAEILFAELSHFGVNFKPSGSTGVIRYNEVLLLNEPFVGYAEVTAPDGREAYLVCRNYTPIDFRPKKHGLKFASYLAPLGALLAQRPGHSTRVVQRTVTLDAKAQFSPKRDHDGWDARNIRIGWNNEELQSESLRDLIRQLRLQREAPGQVAVLAQPDAPMISFSLELRSRRPVIQVTQLPDRAILDDIQDPVFRHSIAGPILITGAPGTGKTTVQIKRLAQKTKWEFLTADERSGLDASSWVDNEGWIFFTPTALLKSYLKEALAKERLVASDTSVRVWRDYQVELLRRVRFLRVSDSDDAFRRAPDGISILRDRSSAFSVKLAVAFINWLTAEIETHVRNIMELPEDFRNPLAAISNRRDQLAPRIKEKLGYAHLFRKIPALYDRFRKEPDIRRQYYREGFDLDLALKEMRIDAQEMSILLYAALRWVRTTWLDFNADISNRNAGGPSYLIQDQRTIVAIDEASDFSAVEIAAMSLLADPRKASVSLSGDLMQRLTTTGLRAWVELEELGIDAPRFDLRRAYRQTDRLTRLAGKLYSAFSGDTKAPTDSVNPADNDPPVLVQSAATTGEAAVWIGKRIREIFDLSGGRLPSIGVLMPAEEDVVPFTKLLGEALFDASIDVEGSLGGQSLGNTNKVRVFCVDHIKGLEFESVFFCDIDIMAEKQGELIDKLVYVGLSRARSFLGMTYRVSFPKRLAIIQRDLLFADRFAPEQTLQPWRSYLDEDLVGQIGEPDQALLDKHFAFYWNLACGKIAAVTPAQKDFVRFSKSVSTAGKLTPRNEHQRAFKVFLEQRALRAAD